jgi:hypothetical protein
LIAPPVSGLLGQREHSVRGKAALRDYFARGLQAYSTLRFEFIELYPGVRICVVEYRCVNGWLSAELMEFDVQGKARRVLAHYSAEP